MAGHYDGLCDLPSAHAVHHGDADGGQFDHHGFAVRGQPHPVHRERGAHACCKHVLLDLVDLPDAGRVQETGNS